MRAADRLGSASSFAEASRPRSERRRLIAEVTGDTPPASPAAVPTTASIEQLAHNPFNPRDSLGSLEEVAASLVEKGQVQPITVVTRAAFLAVHPGQEPAIGDADFVVLDGNRRFAAAVRAGLDSLRIDVNDKLAASSEEMLESSVVANIHRQDLAPLDEAKALRYLVGVHGSQGKVAKRLGKTPAWVSQRLALLELEPELQQMVETKQLKVEDGRRIGRLPKQEQADAATAAVNAVNTPRPRRARQPRETVSGAGHSDTGGTVNGVNTSTSATPPPGEAALVPTSGARGDSAPSGSHGSQGLPDYGADGDSTLDWGNLPSVAAMLRLRLAPAELQVLVQLLTDGEA